MSKQSEGKQHVEQMLADRGVKSECGIVEVGEQPWAVFEYKRRCIAIDPRSGVWIGQFGGNWQCLSSLCTVSSTAEAVEFLLNER